MKHERIFRGAPARALAPRVCQGIVACSDGRLAESAVAREYLARGYELVAERWRGQGGEIDLVLREGDEYVFVEVKKASLHRWAAERIGHRQIARICNAALEFCGCLSSGLLTAMRFDAALVNQFGQVEIHENAFGMN